MTKLSITALDTVMMGVANKPVMLSVISLSVVMLSVVMVIVVAPSKPLGPMLRKSLVNVYPECLGYPRYNI